MGISSILDIVVSLVAVFIAIVLHEVSHGYVAYRLGDPTARNRGRLTLNPLAHIDPIGTVLVPLVLAILPGRFLFGWAKPVPINPRFFRDPHKGMLYVAVAGPGMNIALALSTSLVGRLVLSVIPPSVLYGNTFGTDLIQGLFNFLGLFVVFNVILAVFNMVPIPPLDGSRVLSYFLPWEGKRLMMQLERYGFLIILGLLYLGVLNGLFGVILKFGEILLGQQWAG